MSIGAFFRRAAFALVYSLTFAALSGFLLLRFGPYPDLRRAAAESILTSMHRGYAGLLVSPNELARLRNSLYPVLGIHATAPAMFARGADHRVQLFTVRSSRYRGYVLLVHDPRSVAVGYSQRLPRAGETTSSIARRLGAVAAINAGGFGDNAGAGTGGSPQGVIVHGGRFVFSELNARYRKIPIVGFNRDGALVVGEMTRADIMKLGIREAISFGPPLVVNGKPVITQGDGGWGIAPRTAIGQRRDGTVILLVVDGRQVDSIGATLRDVQDILLSYGAYVAANLDGGSSTTMYYHGRVINHPCDPMGERMVPTVFFVRGDTGWQ